MRDNKIEWLVKSQLDENKSETEWIELNYFVIDGIEETPIISLCNEFEGDMIDMSLETAFKLKEALTEFFTTNPEFIPPK